MKQNNFLKTIDKIKAFSLISENEMFQNHNMLYEFEKLYEELENNISRLESLEKIRFNQKQILCHFVLSNKKYLNDISDIRSYFFNVLYALEKTFNSKIEKRQFVLYKDRKNKIIHRYSLKIGDLTFFDIDAKRVMKEFKEHFSLDFKDNSGGIKEVNHILKHSNKAILVRLDNV